MTVTKWQSSLPPRPVPHLAKVGLIQVCRVLCCPFLSEAALLDQFCEVHLGTLKTKIKKARQKTDR